MLHKKGQPEMRIFVTNYHNAHQVKYASSGNVVYDPFKGDMAKTLLSELQRAVFEPWIEPFDNFVWIEGGDGNEMADTERDAKFLIPDPFKCLPQKNTDSVVGPTYPAHRPKNNYDRLAFTSDEPCYVTKKIKESYYGSDHRPVTMYIHKDP